MDRTPKRLTALWALCLLLLSWSGEALGSHACAHHLRIGPAEGGAHAASAGAEHASHGHHAAQPGGEDPAGEGHDACTCASGCPSLGAGASLPDEAAAALRVAAARAPLPRLRPDAVLPRAAVHHLLPFGHGPPPAV